MLLAIDTSTEFIGLAIYDGAQVLAEFSWRSNNYHTVELVPAIETMLSRAGIKRTELTGLGVAIGPGSFTGLRIGLSVAKGLALALNLPAIGIPSLDVLAASQPPLRRPMLALLKVGRGRFAHIRYVCKKNVWVPQGEIQVDDARTIAATITSPVYICGEMNAEERKIFGRKWKTTHLAPASLCVRRPSMLAEMAWAKLNEKKTHNAVDLTPIYVHTLSNVPDV